MPSVGLTFDIVRYKILEVIQPVAKRKSGQSPRFPGQSALVPTYIRVLSNAEKHSGTEAFDFVLA